jgi:hypothetical protein
MQFTVINNCDFPICALSSNTDYTDKDLSGMLNVKDTLKKAVYDYYWGSQINHQWAVQVQKNTVPYFKYYGFAQPSDSIEVYNLSRVSEYLYAFFTKIVDKKITLWYYQIPIRSYFNQYDTMAVYQFTVRINEGSGNPVITSDASTGALLVDYFGDPIDICTQQVDWVPSMSEQTNNQTWQLPLIILVFVVMIIVAVIIVFVITIKQPNSVNKYISQRVERVEVTEPEYLS